MCAALALSVGAGEVRMLELKLMQGGGKKGDPALFVGEEEEGCTVVTRREGQRGRKGWREGG